MQGTNFRYLYKRQIYRGLGGYKQCNNCRGCGSTYTVPFHRDVSLHFALVCTFKNDTAYTLTLDINLTYNNSFADMSTLIAHVCFDDRGKLLESNDRVFTEIQVDGYDNTVLSYSRNEGCFQYPRNEKH